MTEQSSRGKPCETGKGIAIPESIQASYSLVDGGNRWYLDTITLKGEIVVKLAVKRPSEWSPSWNTGDPSIWVSVSGILAHLWREEIFRALGSLAGIVVEINMEALRGERLERARVRILASPSFAQKMQVPIRMENFQYVAVIEEEKKKKYGKVKKKKKRKKQKYITRVWRRKEE
ncbi:hypothetical protein H6P81_003543 [Aristolochia fimbriata]|uniref:DUF4283 domain-containing protein n=1 Tax=Aristolochia fimbriata TaxID=158543 RepID=A0AAV7FCV7_ARIFI|nr:hypothetical protein H6P81_003543 [Aristolochia fimbriata]